MCKSKIACCWSGWIRLRFSLIFIDISSVWDWSGNRTKSIHSLKCVGFMCKLDSAYFVFFIKDMFLWFCIIFLVVFVQKLDGQKKHMFFHWFSLYILKYGHSRWGPVSKYKKMSRRVETAAANFSFLFCRVEKSLEVSQKQGSVPSISAYDNI